jgi:hypothetical protein
MIKRSLMLAAALAVVTVAAGCKKPEPARPAASAAPSVAASATPASAAVAAPAFSHDASLEVFGYYLPVQEVASGPYKLRNLSLGSEEDFRNWEANKRLESYGPVMLEFNDTSSATTTAENGAEGYAETIRVLPDHYAVSSNGVSFEGHDAKLGAVSFKGRFDAHGFAAARRGDAPQAVVLIGEVKAGGKSFPETRFSWFGGD